MEKSWKGGRPKKAATEKAKPVQVLLTAAEREKVEAQAAKAGMALSAYLREAGLRHRIKSIYDADAVIALVALHTSLLEATKALQDLLETRSAVYDVSVRARDLCQQLTALCGQIDQKLGLV